MHLQITTECYMGDNNMYGYDVAVIEIGLVLAGLCLVTAIFALLHKRDIRLVMATFVVSGVFFASVIYKLSGL